MVGSFKFRLLMAILALLVSLMVVLSIVLAVYNSYQQHQQMLQQQNQVHAFVSNDLVEVAYAGNADVAADLIQKLERVIGLQGLWIENKDQQVVYSYLQPSLTVSVEISQVAAGADDWVSGEMWRHEEIQLFDQKLGKAHYWYQVPSFLSNLWAYLQLSVLLLPLIILVALIFAQRVVNHFMRPHEQLLNAIQAPESVHGAVLLPEDGVHAEVAQLFRGFNALQQRVHITQEGLEEKVRQRTLDLTVTNQALMSAQNTLAIAHQQIHDSIKYGALIQHTLLPEDALFSHYFQESFIYWQPKDTVGGDLYFFDPLRHDDECFLMMIDCTGHGVPGAFVTMLVKAIERHLIARLSNSDDVISPADILSVFNHSMKHLLKQDDLKTSANTGFDGCIVYLNKREGKMIFSGAETSLFYRTNTQALTEIKGNRHSIGYRQSDSYYVFTDHTLTIESGLQIYLTTDGYLDQNGGEKGFPLGKKRFLKVAESCQSLPLNEQKGVFEAALLDYQGDNHRNDDVTLLSMRF